MTQEDEILVTGLGDAIGMAGAAVAKSEQGSTVSVSTYLHNKPSVDSFFIHHPKITLKYIPYLPPEEAHQHLQSFIGNLNDQEAETPELAKYDFYLRTYIRMGVDFRHRWDSCPLDKAADSVEQVYVPFEDYTFIHECPSRGFIINRDILPEGPIVFPQPLPDRSILAFKQLARNCRRAYVIDSCFFHFLESLELDPSIELYLVRHARSYCPGIHDYATRHKWTEIW